MIHARLILLSLVFSLGTSLADTIQVYFSPKGQCTEAAVAQINLARKDIAFEAYNFTSPEILNALKAAMDRGVKIRAIYDRSQKNVAKSLADELGVRAAFGSSKIMHNKVLVIDSRVVVTGSFNWTTNAERFNAENMVVLDSPATAKKYLENFEKLLSTSTAR